MNEKKPVVIERVFNAPLERVWAAWTEPELVQKWWGPKDFTAPSVEIDFRVGGKYLYCMRGKVAPDAPEQDFWSTGVYKEIDPMKRIVATDCFADADGNVVSPAVYGMTDFDEELVLTVDFESIEDGKTKVTLTHVGAGTGPQADNMVVGWNQSLDKFATSLE
jgi:uncharacterized protein YndB with AHSA1/START domain